MVRIEEVPWLFLMVAAGGLGLALAAGALNALRRGRRRLAVGFAAGLAGLVGVYLIALVGVSTASQRHVLPPGEVKRFCGAYLDCHLGVSVEGVKIEPRVGDPGRTLAAKGAFHIVTLRVSSDARRATLTPYGLRAVVVDERGRRFGRHREAERALPGAGADRPLEQAVPAGGSYTRTIVFDLPPDAIRPAVSVTEQAFPDVALEWFLIGDEDSIFHRPTLLGLAPAGTVGVQVSRPAP